MVIKFAAELQIIRGSIKLMAKRAAVEISGLRVSQTKYVILCEHSCVQGTAKK